MRVKDRLTPYPILDDYGDDYIQSKFSAEFDVTLQFNNICCKIEFTLDNDELIELISKAKAEYLVHIECPATCYRKKICSSNQIVEFEIQSSEVAKQIEIRTFIVAKEDVLNYESKSFHPDYRGETFDILAHQIMAIGTGIDYLINKDERDLELLPSIVQIEKMSNPKKGTMMVNTDNDGCIVIGLYEEVYELYASLGKSTFKSTAFSLILFPAFVVVLQRMYENRNDEDYKSRKWFQVINQLLIDNKICLDDINIENDSLLKVAQAIFSNPIARSFEELYRVSERV